MHDNHDQNKKHSQHSGQNQRDRNDRQENNFPGRSEASHAPASSAAEGQDEARYRTRYRDAAYYSTGRNWRDYAPAYHYGRVAHDTHPGERFEAVEQALADHWDSEKQGSRLVWAEARGAVRDIWKHLDDIHPGSVDRRSPR